MSQYTLIRPGPKRYVLNRTNNLISVTVERKVMQVNVTRSVVQVGGSEPVEDIDFLLAYQLAKL